MIYLVAGPAAIASKADWLPILRRAIEESDGRWSEEQLLADVEEGRALVWIVTQRDHIVGCFTTRVIKSSIVWVLIDNCAGNDLHEWIMQALNAVETWARELGASQIIAEGRLGWQKALKPFGYEPKLVSCVKQLQTLN